LALKVWGDVLVLVVWVVTAVYWFSCVAGLLVGLLLGLVAGLWDGWKLELAD